MLELIALVGSIGAAIGGYLKSRDFVGRRLRFVDAVQRPGVPILVGVAAALVAGFIVSLLPVFGSGTALLFGASVALGTRAGVRRIRREDRRLAERERRLLGTW